MYEQGQIYIFWEFLLLMDLYSCNVLQYHRYSFDAQIVSNLERSPFPLAPMLFWHVPTLFFEDFFTLAQDILGLSLFSFLIE